MNQAGRGDPLGKFHKPIEGPSHGHQSLDLMSPDVGDGARLTAMLGLCPKLLAALLQPKVQAVEIPKRRYGLPEPMAHVLHVLLDLSPLPIGRWITELRLEQVMSSHRLKTEIDAALFAAANPVHRSTHVVVDPASRHATEHPEGVMMRVEQHLMRLQWIDSDDESPAMAELAMRNL